MKTNIRKSAEASFIVSLNDIEDIYKFCDGLNSEAIKFKVLLCNGEEKQFDNFEEIKKIPNSKEKRITSIEIYSNNGDINCSFTSDFYPKKRIYFYLKDEDTSVPDKVWEIMEGTKTWYRFIKKEVFEFIFLLFLCFVIGYAYFTFLPESIRDKIDISTIFTISVPFLLIFLLTGIDSKIMNIFFPKAIFRIGSGGEKYFKTIAIRQQGLGALILIVISIIVEKIFL